MGLFNRKKKKEKEVSIQQTDINGTPLEEFSEEDFKDEFFDVTIPPEQPQQPQQSVNANDGFELDDFVDESFEDINFESNDTSNNEHRRNIELPEIDIASEENIIPDDGTSTLESNDVSNTFTEFNNVRQRQAQEEFDGIVDTSLDDIVIEDVPYETFEDDQLSQYDVQENNQPANIENEQAQVQPSKHQLVIDLSSIPNPFSKQDLKHEEIQQDEHYENEANSEKSDISENESSFVEQDLTENQAEANNDYTNEGFIEYDELLEDIDETYKQSPQEETQTDNNEVSDYDDNFIDDDLGTFVDDTLDELTFNETSISDELDESELDIDYDENMIDETFAEEPIEQSDKSEDTIIENEDTADETLIKPEPIVSSEETPTKKAPKKWLGSLAIDDFDKRYNDIFATSDSELLDMPSENIESLMNTPDNRSQTETELPDAVEPESLLGTGYEQNEATNNVKTSVRILNNEELFKNNENITIVENTDNNHEDHNQGIQDTNTAVDEPFEENTDIKEPATRNTTDSASIETIADETEKTLDVTEKQHAQELSQDNDDDSKVTYLEEEEKHEDKQIVPETKIDNSLEKTTLGTPTLAHKEEVILILDKFDKKVAKIIDDDDDADAKELKRIANLQPEQTQEDEEPEDLSNLRGAELAAKIEMPSVKRERAITGFFVTMSDLDKMNVLLALRNGLLRSGDVSRVLNITLSEANSVLKKLSGDKIITTEKIDGSVYYKINDPIILELINKAETFIDENDAENRMSRKVKAPVQEKKPTNKKKQ